MKNRLLDNEASRSVPILQQRLVQHAQHVRSAGAESTLKLNHKSPISRIEGIEPKDPRNPQNSPKLETRLPETPHVEQLCFKTKCTVFFGGTPRGLEPRG